MVQFQKWILPNIQGIDNSNLPQILSEDRKSGIISSNSLCKASITLIPKTHRVWGRKITGQLKILLIKKHFKFNIRFIRQTLYVFSFNIYNTLSHYLPQLFEWLYHRQIFKIILQRWEKSLPVMLYLHFHFMLLPVTGLLLAMDIAFPFRQLTVSCSYEKMD